MWLAAARVFVTQQSYVQAHSHLFFLRFFKATFVCFAPNHGAFVCLSFAPNHCSKSSLQIMATHFLCVRYSVCVWVPRLFSFHIHEHNDHLSVPNGRPLGVWSETTYSHPFLLIVRTGTSSILSSWPPLSTQWSPIGCGQKTDGWILAVPGPFLGREP